MIHDDTHSNDAFAKLGDDLLGCLLQPEYVLVLQYILNYHYTYGKVLAGDLSSGQVITMANGKDITVNIDPQGLVFINECRFPTDPECPVVEITDVMATNGVIHAINNVLIPPDVNVEEFLDMCLATDPPTFEPTIPTPEPTTFTKSSKKSTDKSKKSGKGKRNRNKSRNNNN